MKSLRKHLAVLAVALCASTCSRTDLAEYRQVPVTEDDHPSCIPTVLSWEKWEHRLGFRPETGTALFQGPVLTDDGAVWAFGRDYHPQDGTPLGRRDISKLMSDIVADARETRYEIDEKQRLWAYEKEQSEPVSVVDEGVMDLPIFNDNGLGAVTTRRGIITFDIRTFQERWRYETPLLHNIISIRGNRLYIREHRWYTVFDLTTGAVTARSEPDAEGLTLTPNDTVIYRPVKDTICSAHGGSLARFWCIQGGIFLQDMTVDDAGNIYAVVRWAEGNHYSRISLAATDGTFRWIHPLSDLDQDVNLGQTVGFEQGSNLLINVDNTLVYKRPHGLDVFDIHSGFRKWTYNIEETESIYGFTIGPSGDYYLIVKKMPDQTYRIIKLDHIYRSIAGRDLICNPCQPTCVNPAELARCRPDGNGFTDHIRCPTGTECRSGSCTECVATEEKGCDGQDYVYLDTCGNGHTLIESCGAIICEDDTGCRIPLP